MADVLTTILHKIFGSSSERYVKRNADFVAEVNRLEDEYEKLSDEELKEKTNELKSIVEQEKKKIFGNRSIEEMLEELKSVPEERRKKLKAQIIDGLNECAAVILPQAFAAVREACKRNLPGHRHFDVQLIGGKVLHEGKIAEMATGEGKTLVATLPVYINVLLGLKVHVVSVNDYLVKRDRDWMAPIYEALGLTVGAIQSSMDTVGEERKQQYQCDITYGTNNEFGFDYLRDNMKIRKEDQVQGPLHYAIIDEVDSILIDEARTPLIISGPARDDINRYRIADRVAKALIAKQQVAIRETQARIKDLEPLKQRAANAGIPESRVIEAAKKFQQDPTWLTEDEAIAIAHKLYYIVERDRKSVHMTHDGISVAQDEAKIGSFYVGANMEWPHLIENALRANVVYEKDKDYVVQNGEVIIVDEFTGRLMHGRQWSEGLHQAVEAKEGVQIKEETQTLATITIQNYFKLYCKLSGMTGTAMTEADEFMKIYNLDVVAIPTNRPVNRVDHNDRIYKTMREKYNAIVEEIRSVSIQGFPDDPELMSRMLKALRDVYSKLPDDKLPINAGQTNIGQTNTSQTDTDADKEQANKEQLNGSQTNKGQADENQIGEEQTNKGQGDKRQANQRQLNKSEVISRIDKVLNDYENDIQTWPAMRDLIIELTPELPRGRPVLVGTVSIENSEKLSNLLTRKYGIEHEVLNAKHHEREAEIVAKAGHRHPPKHGGKSPEGNVTIATNMAGRGTDIKLEEGVVYPKCIGDLAPREPGVIATKCCINCPDYDGVCAHCFKPKLDPRFPEMGRKFCPIEPPCGLHIVGTERHESRRIDNQLRGRAGRQGDPGSSRFFLSLEDDLLKFFAGDWVLKMLDWLGMEEGMAIENKRISKGIERAQKKVEERNFAIRKNLLEYDEVMDYQRQVFYNLRQRILEGKNLEQMIWGMISDVVDNAISDFLDEQYPARCISEWVRSHLSITIPPNRVDTDGFEDLVHQLKQLAKEEAVSNIEMTIGEYLDPDIDRKDWDYSGLAKWAMSRFNVSMSITQLRKSEPEEIQEKLTELALEKIEQFDFAPLQRFLEPNFARANLAEWAKNKFAIELRLGDIKDLDANQIRDVIMDKIREKYLQREIEFPVNFVLAQTIASEDGQGSVSAYGFAELVDWVNMKYRLGWSVDDVQNKDVKTIRNELLAVSRSYLLEGKLEQEIEKAIEESNGSAEKLSDWCKERYFADIPPEKLSEGNPKDVILPVARSFMRRELTGLEQMLLLSIYDSSWKEHLLAMDHLKQAIGFRGYAERDPKIEYKREGTAMFNQMLESAGQQVTDLIMKVEITGPMEARSVWQIQQAQHAEMSGFSEEDRQAAMQRQGQGQEAVKTIKRDKPKVKPNDPCPCGSGKKYKKCCGRKH